MQASDENSFEGSKRKAGVAITYSNEAVLGPNARLGLTNHDMINITEQSMSGIPEVDFRLWLVGDGRRSYVPGRSQFQSGGYNPKGIGPWLQWASDMEPSAL